MNDNDLVQITETTGMGDGRGLKSFSFKCKSHFEIQKRRERIDGTKHQLSEDYN